MSNRPVLALPKTANGDYALETWGTKCKSSKAPYKHPPHIATYRCLACCHQKSPAAEHSNVSSQTRGDPNP